MATNEFKPFATGSGANVTPQNEWETLPALLTGFSSGKASSAQVNKAIRQASFIASALAQFVSDNANLNVLDDGDIAGFTSKLKSAFAKQYLSRNNPFGDIKADGAVNAAKINLGLQAFNISDSITTVSAPTSGVFFYVADGGSWGVQDSGGNALPLSIAGGGTGANTLTGARVNLGVVNFSSSGTTTTVSAPNSGVFLYVSDSGNWGVQNSVGTALPLTIAGGGTGANTLTGARVNLGIAQFGISGSVTAMSSPDSSKSVVIDNAGTWGAQTSTGTVIPLSIARGGTGAASASGARTALGLGTAATKDVGTSTGQIPDMSAFPYSAAAKGYVKLPNGLLFQWGRISMAAANATGDVAVDNFAISFPNGVLHTYATGGQTLTNTPCFATSEAIDTNQIRLKAIAVNLTDKTITQGMSVTVEWFAIGS